MKFASIYIDSNRALSLLSRRLSTHIDEYSVKLYGAEPTEADRGRPVRIGIQWAGQSVKNSISFHSTHNCPGLFSPDLLGSSFGWRVSDEIHRVKTGYLLAPSLDVLRTRDSVGPTWFYFRYGQATLSLQTIHGWTVTTRAFIAWKEKVNFLIRTKARLVF